ncbi:MAG: enhanced serine sensitivity protein SseB, partial [Clostridiales bacterium]|nr:enhanced serine sensitivity protein SseB [Clostridiales bacterium]
MSNNKPPLVRPKAVPKVGPTANQNQPKQGAANQQQITNPILCKAMDIFKADPNVSTQNTFVQQLFKSRLLIPCSAIKKTEKDGKSEVQLQFLTLKNKQGDNLFGVFTDWEQIKKQTENTPKEAAALPFPEILKIAVGQRGQIKGILINPFEHGLMLDENTILKMDENLKKAAEQIKAQKAAGAGVQTAAPAGEPEGITLPGSEVPHSVTPKKSPEDDILYIGEPLEEPYEITKELSRYFKSVKAVNSAYFLEIYRSDHGKPSPLVVIDYRGDKDTKERVYSEIREIYNEKAEEPMELTIM